MFTLFGKKTPSRPDIVVIASTAGVLARHAVAVHDSWQPTWSQSNLFSILLSASHTQTTPIDTAIQAFATKNNVPLQAGQPMKLYQFSTNTPMSGNVWHYGREYELALKGSPAAIMAQCDLTEDEREDIEKAAARLAAEGYQVVAVAHGTMQTVPSDLKSLQKKITFAGLISTSATLHPKAREAVRNALHAGISVRLLSGSHLQAARQIGKELGILTSQTNAIDSRTLQNMTPEATLQAIKATTIFAEATPSTKKSIIAALKKDYTVTVIGDGTVESSAYYR